MYETEFQICKKRGNRGFDGWIAKHKAIMKRTSDLVEILEANFGHRILIYYLYKKHQRPSSRILTRHLVHPSCLRCEKGMESHDNNMKTVKGRQTGTQRNFVKCLV